MRPSPLCLTANLPIRASCQKQDSRIFRCPAYNKSLIFVTSLAELTIANGAGIYQRSYSYISFDNFTLTSVNPTDSPSFFNDNHHWCNHNEQHHRWHQVRWSNRCPYLANVSEGDISETKIPTLTRTHTHTAVRHRPLSDCLSAPA